MGCALAWRLRQRGVEVILVERGRPGAEASSAAAGILAPQVEADGPGPFLELGLRSRALYPAWVEELREATGIDVGYRREGTLVVAGVDGARDPDAEVAALWARAAWQHRLGLPLVRLEGAEVRGLEPQLRPCAAALYFPEDRQLEAPLLARALAQAAAQMGVRFVTAHVHQVIVEGTGERRRAVGVAAQEQRLSAGHIVIAAGAWSSLVEGTGLPGGAVAPMRGQMLELDTCPPLLRHLVFGQVDGVAGYLVPRRDGRLVCGSTMERVGFRKEVTVAGLRRLLELAEGLVPALAQAEVRRIWAGFRPYTSGGLPLLGPTPIAGLLLCTGHFRNGILLCPISAEALCACITGQWAAGVAPVDLAPFSLAAVGANPAGHGT